MQLNTRLSMTERTHININNEESTFKRKVIRNIYPTVGMKSMRVPLSIALRSSLLTMTHWLCAALLATQIWDISQAQVWRTLCDWLSQSLFLSSLANLSGIWTENLGEVDCKSCRRCEGTRRLYKVLIKRSNFRRCH